MAGPWARGENDIFLSFQIAGEAAPSLEYPGLWEPETYYSGYAEYGLGHNLTLGFDGGFGEIRQQAVGFLRYTLTPSDATWQMAVDAGYGLRRREGQDAHNLVRIGASIGRGFGGGGEEWYMPLVHQGGWFTVDAVTLFDLEIDDEIYQIEGTLGFNINDSTATILAVKAEDWPDADLLVTLSPSVVFQLGPDTSVQLGARAALEGSDTVGMSLSLWREF